MVVLAMREQGIYFDRPGYDSWLPVPFQRYLQ